MAYQGAGGNRGARQAGAQPRPGPGSGPQPGLRPGTGPQPGLRPGTGPQPGLRPGTGPQPAAGRDPARGYPQGPARKYPETDWLVPGLEILESGPPADQAASGRRGGKRGGRRRKLLLALLGLVVLAGGGAAGYKYLYKNTPVNPVTSGALRLPSSNPTAQSTYYSAKLGKWQHITSRKLDPAPLSVAELFPPAVGFGGKQYLRAVTSLDKNCGAAVYGSQLQSEFQSGTCTQVARATYVSGDQKIMGTIGVVNLSSVYWSEQAAKLTSTSGELIAPLSAAKGLTKNILNGTGLTFAAVKGHYLILMYVEFTSLKAPAGSAQNQQLAAFSQGMWDSTANIALSRRQISGQP